MEEIIVKIQALLSRGGNMMDLHLLHKELAVPPEIFWMATNLTIDFILWSASLQAKAGVMPETSVLGYLAEISAHVRNILYSLKGKPIGN
jgi:hypothetical protein